MKIRYVGPFGAVSVPLASGVSVLIPQFEVGDFPDEMAERMLEQDIWELEASVIVPAEPVPVDEPPVDPAVPAEGE